MMAVEAVKEKFYCFLGIVHPTYYQSRGWGPWLDSYYYSGIDKSLALERKIESRKRNFSLDLENLIVPISLSTLDFREWQETILFLLSIFESGKNKFSFHSRFSRVARQISLSTLVFFSIFESSNREFNIIYSRWFKIDQPISVPEVWYYFFTYDLDLEF